MNNADHITESLETIFDLKSGIRDGKNSDPGSRMEKFGSGIEKYGSGKHIPDLQHWKQCSMKWYFLIC